MPSGKATPFEASVFTSYAPGDVFRVAVVGGVVQYSRNEAVFYTSSQTPSYPLLVDSWLNNQGATLNGAVIASLP